MPDLIDPDTNVPLVRPDFPDFWETLLTANRLRSARWGSTKFDLSFKAMELGGEVGEFLNMLKKVQRERLGVAGRRVSMRDVKLEFGDVLICLGLVANELGWTKADIDEALYDAFNVKSMELGLPTMISIDGGVHD